MNTRFTIFVFVVSACFAFIGHANMYNDWAQKNAVNLNGPSASETAQIDIVPRNDSEAIALAAGNSMRSKKNIETALKNNATALPRPNVGLISSDEVSGYPYVDRYLSELGDKVIRHYYILREDYKFEDLSGGSITIPAGFIWDGASIPTGLLGKVIELVALEVGNTRYNSALSEGLIHDYMYRDPRRFSQEDADDLLYVNLVRCGNADPKTIYKGVQARGGESYQGHRRRQDQGLYDVFTPKFYAENLKMFQGVKDSSLQKPDVCRDAANCSNGSKRKICVCAEPETFFAGVVMVQIIKSKKPSAQYYCRKCGGFRRGDMFDIIRTGNGIATYPAGVLPSDWDGKIYEKTILDEYVKNLLSGSDNSTKATAER